MEQRDQTDAATDQAIPGLDHLHLLADPAIDCAIYTVDPGGRITSWHPGAQRLLGYAAQDILGRPLSCLYGEADRAADLPDRLLRTALAQGRCEADGQRVRQDGTLLQVRANITALHAVDGTHLGFVHVVRDISDLRRAEQALASYVQRLASIIESAMDAIITLDEQERITLFNPAAERMFGCSATEVLGQTLDRFLPERGRAAHPGHIQAFGATNATTRKMGGLGVVYGLRADGSEFPLEASIARSDVGGHKTFTAILRDVSERHQAEEKFRLVVEAAPNGMVMVDRHGRIVLVNAEAERLFGYARSELLGQPVEVLVPERYREAHPGYRARFLADPMIRAMGMGRDLYGRRKDGTEVPVEIGRTPLRTGDGLFVLSAIVDLSARKRAEEMFRLAVESAPNAVVMIDAAGQIVLVNAQTELLFAYTRQELLGQPVEVLVPERYRAPHPGYRARFLADPTVRAMGMGRDLYGRRKDGSEFPVEIGLTPLKTENGLYVLSAIVDITERKLGEERIRTLNQDLEQRVRERTIELQAPNRELDAFSYSVSHDLRAPLRAIDGFSRIVLADFGPQLPEEARTYLEDIRTSTLQMGHLVDDLLAFSRLGRQPLTRQPFDMGKLVRQCLNELQKAQQERHVEVRVGDLPACQGDQALLRQVWLNLLGNALKYSRVRDPAVLEIGCQAGRPPVYFVKDNGVGFDMRYVHKLFGVFQRLHRAEDYAGTGVGLAIVQRIVQRHGGRAWAEAELDRGATFFFTLEPGDSPHA